MSKSPAFTAVAVASLALGIGANTAIFSLLNALLLRDLRVRRPERLVELSVARRGDKIPFSYPMFRELERGQKVFPALIGWSFGQASSVELDGEFSQAEIRSVTGNFFSELDARPLRGRLIGPEDANGGTGAASPVAVLSYDYWQRRFGARPDAVGKQIAIEGQAGTIVGVTQKGFTGMAVGDPADIMIPMKATDDRARLWIFITGRLKDGATLAQAQSQLQTLWPEVLRVTTPTELPGLRRQLFFSMGLDVAPAATGVNRALRDRFRQPLVVLLGITGLILLAACVNLANLMLARAARRSHEMSVRVALGASRWALARQVLAESLTLSVSGALAGLVFAYWGSRALVGLMAEGNLAPVVLDLSPDWRVLSLAAAAAVLTGILFGVVPAWHCSRQDPALALHRNSRSFARAAGGWGKALVVAQVALSLILLLGAGLLARSFQKLCFIDPGLRERVLEVSLYPRPGGYRDLDINSYHRQLLERIARIPGVSAAAFSDVSVLSPSVWRDTVSPATAAAAPDAGVTSQAAMVSPQFFGVLGIPLLRGRGLKWTDDTQHPSVAVISRALAERIFPSGNALGRRIRFGFMPEFQDLEVVGVAANARLFDLHDAAAPVVYVSCVQFPQWSEQGSLFVRASSSPEALGVTVAREIASLGHEYALGAKTVEQEVGQALVEERAIAMLSGFFAGLALLLASVGLYGLMSYSLSRRTREIGIRAALGAERRSVIWLMLREALGLALLGVGLGIPCALAAARLIAGMLFGIATGDLPTLLAASLLLAGVALLAAYLPARRASRVDPVAALRAE